MDAASNGSLASRDSPSVHSSVGDASPLGIGGGEYNTDGRGVEGDGDGPMDLTSTGNSVADLGAMSDVFLRSQWGSHKKLVGIRFLFPPIDESTNLLERAKIWVSRHDYKYFVDWTETDLEAVDPVLRPLSVITRDIYKLHMNRSEYCRNVKLKYCLQSPAAWAQAFRERLMKSATEGGFTGLCQAKIAAAELWRSYSEHYRSHQARRPNNIKTHRGMTDSDITSNSPTVQIKSDPASASDTVEETSFDRECTSCDVLPNGDDDKLTSHVLANGGVWELSEHASKRARLYKQNEDKEEKNSRKELNSMLRGKNERNLESGERNRSDMGASQTNTETRELNDSFYLGDEDNDNEADGDGDDDDEDEEESNKGMNLCRRLDAGKGETNNYDSSQNLKEKTRSEAFVQHRHQDHQRRTPNIPEMIVTPNFPVKMEVQSFADRMHCWNMTSAAAGNLAPVLYGMPLAAYYANPMACLLNPSAATSLRQVYESYLPSAAVISPPAPLSESIEHVTPLSYKKSSKHRNTNRSSHNTAAGGGGSGSGGAVANNGTTELSSEYRRSERGLSFLFPSFSDHSMSLIDKVRITIARHKNNYFLGWDEAALSRLDPLVRPKMAVTPEIYKEYCHRNAMKYDSNLQFAMESEEPWADEFRAKLSLQPCDGGFSSLCEVKLEAGRLWREYSGKYRMHNIVKWQMDMNNSGDVTSSTTSLARNERLRKHSRRVRGGNSSHLIQSAPHGNYSGNNISSISRGNFCIQPSSVLNYATDANRNHLADKNPQVSIANDDIKTFQPLTSSTTQCSTGGIMFCVTSPSSISLGGREFSREEVRIRASRSLDNSPLSTAGLGGAVLTPEVSTAPLDRRSLSSSSVITTVTSPDIDVFNPTFSSAVHDTDQTTGVLTTSSKSPNSHKVLHGHQDHAMFPIMKGGLNRHDSKYNNNNSKLINESSTLNKEHISREVVEDSLFAPLPFDLPVCEQICIWLERHRNGYFLGHSEEQLNNLDLHLRPRQVVTPDIFRQNIPESIVDVLSKIDAMMTPSNLNGFYGENWARRFRERVLNGESEGGFATFEEALTEAVHLWHINAEGKSSPITSTAENGTGNSSTLKKRSWDLDESSLSKLPFPHGEIKRQRLDEKARHNNIDDENNEIDCKAQDVHNRNISGLFDDIKNNESTSLENESPSLPYKRSLLGTFGHDGSKLKRARSQPTQSLPQDGKSVDSLPCSTTSSLDRKIQILWASRAELYLLCADSPSTSWSGRLAPFLTTLRAAITPDYEVPTTSTMCTVDLILALLHERLTEDSKLSAPDATAADESH